MKKPTAQFVVRVESAYLYEPSHWAKMYAPGVDDWREGWIMRRKAHALLSEQASKQCLHASVAAQSEWHSVP